MSSEEKRKLIEPEHPNLDIKTQCLTLGLCRSSYYYAPIKTSREDMSLMKTIEELHYKHPELGYRKIHAHLRRKGAKCGIGQIERLWCKLGFRSILPEPNLSQANARHTKYPYLLNDVRITYPGQVFSTDITFIPVAGGFMYLASVTDWFSRFTLSWELSNTLSTEFCLEACEKAFRIKIPTLFNMDQGAQFTSQTFIDLLLKNGIQISMDSKGRAIDNVYQERSWWSLKYEKIYPGCYESVSQVKKAIEEYYEYFNQERPHEGLFYATPEEIFYGRSPKYSKGRYEGFVVKGIKTRRKYKLQKNESIK